MAKPTGVLAEGRLETGLSVVMQSRHNAKQLVCNRSIANVGLLGLMLAVSGCAVGSDFETPEVKVQNSWIEKHDARVKTKEA